MFFKDKIYLVTVSISGISQGIAKDLLENGVKNYIFGDVYAKNINC